MRNQRFISLILTGLLTLGLVSTLTFISAKAKEADAPLSSLSSTTVQQIKADENGLQFTLQTPPLTTSDKNTVHVTGLNAQVQNPGAPALPYYSTFIALPPEATATIQIKTLSVATQFAKTILAVPQAIGETKRVSDIDAPTAVTADTSPLTTQPDTLINMPDPAIYQQNALYPATAYTLSEPTYYRDLRLVELRLYPVRYNPVTQELQQTQLEVALTFEGGQTDNTHPAADSDGRYLTALSDAILNYDQAQGWRSLPQEVTTAATSFPVNAAETYKIEVNQDGIYEISGADLAAQGMNIAAVNPAAIQMMHRGQPVATQFIGDSDSIFESNEKIRFYGWAFDGPRSEKQFISNNVFWLWANGTATTVAAITNPTGGTIVTQTLASVTREPENIFSTTYTDQWDAFPNDPDGWYWDYISFSGGSTDPLTKTYTISLPHPAITGDNATYTVEMLPRDKSLFSNPANYAYTITTRINNGGNSGELSWIGKKDVNIVGTIPLSTLVHQNNDVHLIFTASTSKAALYLNRITVDYTRQLIADGNQLIFSDDTTSAREFQVAGFSESNPNNVLVWNISDRNNPQQINMNGRISGSGSYVYQIGSDTNDTHFIATTSANTLAPAKISQYIPANLTPPAGGADWIAITPDIFRAQANRLAVHRASFSQIQTWVVDYEDVINQYGYGLPLPSAIRDYLAQALNWSPAPGYVTLFGAATYNPRNLDCQHNVCPFSSQWDKDQPTHIVTDLVFKDRYQGVIPSDHTMTLLSGNDLLPDIAIGRITADTVTDATAVVSKIIRYEQSQSDREEWQQNLLFVADMDDPGAGYFYHENQTTVDEHIPQNFAVTNIHLITDTQDATDALRTTMLNDINGPGVAILNYRGHGAVTRWASPSIISSDDQSTDFWNNYAKPTVILSADCLDGNFAFPGRPALSKTILTLQSGTIPVGTSAHWSSTGLGQTNEHSVLHRGFYDGLFKQESLTIGNAINYAKLIYYQGDWHNSEMYSFLLQGDPAMQILVPKPEIYLPIILNP